MKTNARCTDLAGMAERELAAFFGAVTELFGSKQAELSAEEWLKELNAMADLPGSSRGFRLISTSIAARLATRMNALAAAS